MSDASSFQTNDPKPASAESAKPAHSLWVELSTRITTQRLHYCSGDEETASSSIHSLFKKTRELMEANLGAKEFHTLALALLNDTLRPYTARWHGWMTADAIGRDGDGKAVLKFRDEWVRRQFRRELRALQPRLLGFQKAFDAMRKGEVLDPRWTSGSEEDVASLLAESSEAAEVHLGAALKPGIRNQIRFSPLSEEQRVALCEKIDEAEHAFIRRRRAAVLGTEVNQVSNATALAYSGGGIRSATFCLGITQVLARRKLLPRFDYVSTVSGGGYFGSFLSACLGTGDHVLPPASVAESEPPDARARRQREDDAREMKARVDSVFEVGDDQREPRALRHLRNYSRYLADGTFGRKLAGIGIVLLGVLFNLLIVLPLPLIGALLTKALHKSNVLGFKDWTTNGTHWLPSLNAPWSWLLWIVLGFLAVVALRYPGIKVRVIAALRRKEKTTELKRWEKCFVAGVVLGVVMLAWWLVPLGFRLYHAVRTAEIWPWFSALKGRMESLAGVFGLSLTVILSALASKLKGGGKFGSWLKTLAILSGPVLYLGVYFCVGYRMMFAAPAETWPWYWVLLMTAALVVWAWGFVDVNTYSPHGYYRDRITECYLLRRKNKADAPGGYELEHADAVLLSELNESAAAPYHLINATVNLPTSTERELRGRNADFFVFSKHYSGSPISGYYKTTDLETADPHLDLGTALAISGAAASSNMGWQTDNSLRLLMTLANVRLGYWLRNPNPAFTKDKKLRGPGPGYILREMFSLRMDESQNYLNLSDGGHHENLAVYELLRRRTKFIVCVDGGCEPDMACTDLIRLERYAAIDLGIKMHYDISDLLLQPNGCSRAYATLVKIDYNPPENESRRRARKPQDAEWGWMLYIKLAMVGYGPGYVMDYKRTHPDFPHESTGDQIYDEAQFEAYRALGEAAAESLFTEELLSGRQPETIESWFATLASSLLPDNDEAQSKEAKS